MMHKLLLFLSSVTMFFISACSQKTPDNFVFVEGGAFVNTKSAYYGSGVTVNDFYIGKYEVTQKEWADVMGYNPSQFKGDSLPVESVTWYDCIEYCNKRSLKEGLTLYYNIDKNKKDPDNIDYIDSVKWLVTINKEANGYRLPTDTEWEYAAGGGKMSKSFLYSGSNNLDEAGWYWQNSGDNYLTGTWSWTTIQNNNNKTKPGGLKKANELGIYDMSGNVREWCWDWDPSKGEYDFQGRVWKGGGWLGGDYCCEISYKSKHEANGTGPDQGLRVCRSK